MIDKPVDATNRVKELLLFSCNGLKIVKYVATPIAAVRSIPKKEDIKKFNLRTELNK